MVTYGLILLTYFLLTLVGVGEQPDGNNVINRSEYFLCQASITILLISGVNYDNNSRNEGIPGQLTMSVAAYLNL